MKNDILSKLFGSSHRAKLLRLFILNPGVIFDRATIKDRAKVPTGKLNSEINTLKAMTLIKEKPLPAKQRKGGSKVGFELSASFPMTKQIKNLLNADFLTQRHELVKRFKNCGRIKLLLVSGIFVENADSRVDLVIVGDALKRGVIEKIIKGIEAEVGRELMYSIMDSDDFEYRVSTSDKFVRDIFDFPHELIVDKMPM